MATPHRVFFIAKSSIHAGDALWATDGTALGTTLVNESLPGSYGMFALDNRLFLQGTDRALVSQFRVTDGTLRGSGFVFPSTEPGAGWSVNTSAIDGSRLIFLATNRSGDRVLAESDGTPNASRTVARGTTKGWTGFGSYGQSIVVANNKTIFFARTAESGLELWISEGTDAGTTLLTELASGPDDLQPASLISVGSKAFFTASSADAGRELYVTDGTATGTSRVLDIRPGTLGSDPCDFTVSQGALFFTADDGIHGRELWKSDGTPAGTLLAFESVAGPGSSEASMMQSTGQRLYFLAYDNVRGFEPWSLDADGVHEAGELIPGPDWPDIHDTTLVGDRWFLTGYNYADSSRTEAIWVTDGSADGTSLVAEFPAGGDENWKVTELTAFRGNIVFGGPSTRDPAMYEVWVSDGTPGGTVQITDHPDTPAGSIVLDFSSESHPLVTPAGDRLLFSANDGVRGNALWSTSGRPNDVTLVSDLISNPSSLTAVGNRIYLAASSPATGNELWTTDGTSAGTKLVKDILPGPGSSSPGQLTPFGNRVLFNTAFGPGYWLYISDGTLAGTNLLKQVSVNPSDTSRISQPINGRTCFAGWTGSKGEEPWVTDGTTVGTIMLKDFASGTLDSYPGNFGIFGQSWVFSASLSDSGPTHLWRTNGTPAGTTIIVHNFYASSIATVSNRLLLRAASTASPGAQLWTTDATAAGTTLIHEFYPATAYAYVYFLGQVGSTVYLNVPTPNEGYEMWRTDGTASGTTLVSDVMPGPFDGASFAFASLGPRVFFVGNDGTHGYELMETGGNLSGTKLVADLVPGPAGSGILWIRAVGRRIVFAAETPEFGREIWAYDPCPADINADGFVTGDDYDAFVDAFVVGNSDSDFNQDSFVTGDDFDAFVDAFAVGC